MGMGAMTAAMLRLPMTAVLLTTLFLGSDGFPVIPLTIVAVVVAYVAQVWLSPAPPDRASEDASDSPAMPAPRSAEPRLEADRGTGDGPKAAPR